MNFIVHIGCSKTGSSALQSDLINNYEILKSSGILYPKYLLSKNANQHWKLACLDKNDDFESVFKKYKEDAKSNNCDTIILSSERFCFREKKYIKKFYEALKKDQVTIVFYARNQGEILLSSFLHTLKTGKTVNTNFKKYCFDAYRRFNYNKRIHFWQLFFGKNNVLSFSYHSNDFQKMRISQHFFTNLLTPNIQANVSLADTKSPINRSLSPNMLPIIKILNSQPNQIKKIRKDLFWEMAKCCFDDKELKQEMIDSIPSEIKNYFNKVNIRFNNEYLLPDEVNISF